MIRYTDLLIYSGMAAVKHKPSAWRSKCETKKDKKKERKNDSKKATEKKQSKRKRHAISVTYSECVFEALVIQHALRMRHTRCPVWLYHIFPHYLINGSTFGGGGWGELQNTKCELWFSLQLSSKTFLILRRDEGVIIKNVQYIGLHVKYRLLLSGFKQT